MPNGYSAIRERISIALAGPLPGLAAQARMAPGSRRGELARIAASEDGTWKQAAVLILIYPGERGLALPLTLRRPDLRHHPGQISLPGGALEVDETAEEAALRETREEIGVDPGNLDILGRLTPLRIPHSGYEIEPVVAWSYERPAFSLEEAEVAELLELSLSQLLEEEARGEEVWELPGGRTQVPFWKLGNHKVWGATGIVLSEFAAILSSSACVFPARPGS